MAHTLSVDVIIDGFPSSTFPKQTGKPDYASIQDTHCFLTKNAASIESPCWVVQNVRLEIALTAMQYAIVSPSPFICITDPGPTPTILPWTDPFDENKIILEYADQHCQYDDFRNIDAALRNQLLPAFEDTYPPPPSSNTNSWDTMRSRRYN